MRRPPDTPSIPAASLASKVAGHTVASRTLLSSPMVEVAPAAAASATVSMTPGYAIRPMLPSVANPACSDLTAHSGMISGLTSRTWLGSPIPVFIW